jgi:transcriptional regulator with XRE-family HTH domain
LGVDNQRDTTRESAFTEWLLTEMDNRRWQAKDLAEAAGISRNQVMLVLEHARFPGDKFLRGVATAFGMPQDTVFRLAGLLTDEEMEDVKEDEAARKIRHLLLALDPQGRERAIHLLEQYVRDHAEPAPGAPVAQRQDSPSDLATA